MCEKIANYRHTVGISCFLRSCTSGSDTSPHTTYMTTNTSGSSIGKEGSHDPALLNPTPCQDLDALLHCMLLLSMPCCCCLIQSRRLAHLLHVLLLLLLLSTPAAAAAPQHTCCCCCSARLPLLLHTKAAVSAANSAYLALRIFSHHLLAELLRRLSNSCRCCCRTSLPQPVCTLFSRLRILCICTASQCCC
jgi:hypothetical protein